jgi:bacterioferritin
MPTNLSEYLAELPYPDIQIETKNPVYARMMLSNLGDANSETSSFALYLYDHVVTAAQPEISETFRLIMEAEARHMRMFSHAAFQLGANPRLWTVPGPLRNPQASRGGMSQAAQYWSASQLHYSLDTRVLLNNALALERATIEKYESQAREIKDDALLLMLRRVLLDESMHVEMFRSLMG